VGIEPGHYMEVDIFKELKSGNIGGRLCCKTVDALTRILGVWIDGTNLNFGCMCIHSEWVALGLY